MRLVYLDESGIGKLEEEPLVVVAGVMVDADSQWRMLEVRLEHLRNKYIPKEKRRGFFFHGKDLLKGSKDFPHSQYTREERWEILEELCSLPTEMELPVAWGFMDRRELIKRHPDESLHDIAIGAQAMCCTVCTYTVEQHMKTRGTFETALLIYENNDHCKKIVRRTHNYMRETNTATVIISGQLHKRPEEVFPIDHIIDTAHFADKLDCPILQIADACALVLKRRMMGLPDSERFLKKFEGQLLMKPKADWPQLLPWK